MKKTWIIGAILVLALLAFGAWYWSGEETLPLTFEKAAIPPDFSETGTITRGNPGQKPGVWYLVYEQPGAPALSVELIFDRVAEQPLTAGARMRVEGVRRNGAVSVSSIAPAE